MPSGGRGSIGGNVNNPKPASSPWNLVIEKVLRRWNTTISAYQLAYNSAEDSIFMTIEADRLKAMVESPYVVVKHVVQTLENDGDFDSHDIGESMKPLSTMMKSMKQKSQPTFTYKGKKNRSGSNLLKALETRKDLRDKNFEYFLMARLEIDTYFVDYLKRYKPTVHARNPSEVLESNVIGRYELLMIRQLVDYISLIDTSGHDGPLISLLVYASEHGDDLYFQGFNHLVHWAAQKLEVMRSFANNPDYTFHLGRFQRHDHSIAAAVASFYNKCMRGSASAPVLTSLTLYDDRVSFRVGDEKQRFAFKATSDRPGELTDLQKLVLFLVDPYNLRQLSLDDQSDLQRDVEKLLDSCSTSRSALPDVPGSGDTDLPDGERGLTPDERLAFLTHPAPGARQQPPDEATLQELLKRFHRLPTLADREKRAYAARLDRKYCELETMRQSFAKKKIEFEAMRQSFAKKKIEFEAMRQYFAKTYGHGHKRTVCEDAPTGLTTGVNDPDTLRHMKDIEQEYRDGIVVGKNPLLYTYKRWLESYREKVDPGYTSALSNHIDNLQKKGGAVRTGLWPVSIALGVATVVAGVCHPSPP